MLKCLIPLFCFNILLISTFTLASSIPAEELFRNPSTLGVSLSPEGRFLLDVGQTENVRTLTLIETSTLKRYLISQEPVEKSSQVIDYTWLDDTTIYVKEELDAYIVKINNTTKPLKVDWYEIPINGYILSEKVDDDGEIIFAKVEGDFDEHYRLYKTTIDNLLDGEVGFFQQYRRGLSDAYYFSYDEKNNILIGFTYDEDEEDVQIWYLPSSRISWIRLYHHEIKDKFIPLTFINDKTLAVLTNKDSNYTYLAKFDIKTQQFTDTLYRRSNSDLTNAEFTVSGDLLSVSYIQRGVNTTEYLFSDSKKIQNRLNNRFQEKEIVIIDTNDTGKLNLVLTRASNSPGELYLFSKSTDKLKFIGSLRKNLKDYKLAKAEVFDVAVNDELSIEAIVTKPSAESNGVLLVNPHGGPIGVRDYASFNIKNQFYASRGYTILNVNFRGSSGFGKSFQDEGRGQFGQLIEQDIISVYQSFIKNNHFDYTCAMGTSYGGYSAMMLAIKHPEYFSCAISAFGIFDLPQLFSASNRKLSSEHHDAIKKVMGGDMQQLRDISPITIAHKLQVPVLILAGEKDPIAPFEQSNRMKYTLKKLNKSVDFHAYPNAGHGHFEWAGDIHQHEAIDKFIQSTRSNFYRIISAFKDEDLEKAKYLIKNSKDIDAQDRKGYSLLHYAIELENEQFAISVMSSLLENDAYTEIDDDNSQTPLYLATLRNRPQLVELLLANDADANTKNKQQWTPFFVAAQKGYTEIAEILVKYEADFEYIHPNGLSVLLLTTMKGAQNYQEQLEILELILDYGQNPDVRNKNDRSALMNAALNGKIEIVKLLIKYGANVHAVNPKEKYWTAIDYAKGNENKSIVSYLRHISKITPNPDSANKEFYTLLKNIKNSDVDLILKSIPPVQSLSAVDNKGNSALHYAIKMKDIDDCIQVMDALLNSGAYVNLQNKKQRSPLYDAVVLKRLNVIDFLLKNGADINQNGYKKWTPLMRAISQGSLDIVQSMSHYPINFNSKSTSAGWPLFMYITNYSHDANDKDQAEIGKILIEKGANIEVRSRSGKTPLLMASENGKFNVVKMLIEAGADINAINTKDDNKSAIDYAQQDGHDDIAKYLKSIETWRR